MRFMKVFPILVLSASLLAGCTVFEGSKSDKLSLNESQIQPDAMKYNGPQSKAVTMVYTTKRQLSLTFNGMADKATMERLLNDLDKYGIKATFFLPGKRVAEEPAIAKKILARGHEIENNTMNMLDLSKLSYDKIYQEIKTSNDIIKQKTGVTPRYVRTMTGTYTNDVRLAAAQSGQQAVIGTSLFLHNWQTETPLQKSNYIRKYINRGGIIAMDLQENKTISESVKLIADGAKNVGYKFVTLHRLILEGGERKPLEKIPGYDAAKINPNYNNATYNVMYKKENDPKKEVVLSFDDWGSDFTITKILDILAAYKVKASFFLRADDVEKNPNLARAIAEGGHDVGNHTYSHPVITSITPAQLQQEIVRAHRVITEAIQQQATMLFRPPTGTVNDTTMKVVGATGYHNIANFSVDPNDFNRSLTGGQIVKSIQDRVGNGSVVLLHLLDDTQTIYDLPDIINMLRGQGYSFVRMSELMGLSKGQQNAL